MIIPPRAERWMGGVPEVVQVVLGTNWHHLLLGCTSLRFYACLLFSWYGGLQTVQVSLVYDTQGSPPIQFLASLLASMLAGTASPMQNRLPFVHNTKSLNHGCVVMPTGRGRFRGRSREVRTERVSHAQGPNVRTPPRLFTQ